jgi:hypothetical protein
VSSLRLNTPKKLETFLKILAEESIGMAQASANEPARQRDIIKRMQKDKSALSEEDPEKTAPEVPATQPAPPDEEPKGDKPVARTPADLQPGELKPTLDAVIRAVKEIRSGFGADDSEIERELSSYFDRLDEPERISMIVLMRSVGDIMRREAQGASAPEPGQYNVITSMKPGSRDEKPTSPEAPASEPDSAPAPESGTEDNTPPIKVGEPVSESYRRRIRDLLRSS